MKQDKTCNTTGVIEILRVQLTERPLSVEIQGVPVKKALIGAVKQYYRILCALGDSLSETVFLWHRFKSYTSNVNINKWFQYWQSVLSIVEVVVNNTMLFNIYANYAYNIQRLACARAPRLPHYCFYPQRLAINFFLKFLTIIWYKKLILREVCTNGSSLF